MSRLVPNKNQEAAARALAGRVSIAAGAGSGKTRTLTERFLNALEADPDQGWDAANVDEIVAITFTEKAAGELCERIRDELRTRGMIEAARTVDSGWIQTIHGLCARILRAYAFEAGLDPAFRVGESVELEEMREAAFESAARSVMRNGTSALFGMFDYDMIYGTAHALIRDLKTRGLRSSDLVTPPLPSGTELLARARAVFEEAVSDAAQCDLGSASGSALHSSCDSVLAHLDALQGQQLADPVLGTEIWHALQRFKPRRQGAQVKAILESLDPAHAELVRIAAGLVVKPASDELRELCDAFDRSYTEAKTAAGILDFDDLQLHAKALLDEQPAIRAELRSQIRMVMVDEFQDTDALQLAIVQALAGDNLCTVGDEQQSIYGFRGADVGVYRAHNESMRAHGVREFRLDDNYRSHGDVLGFVNKQFEPLFGDSLIALKASRTEPEPPLVSSDYPRVQATLVQGSGRDGVDPRMVEADAVGETFACLRDEHGVDPADMVVLLRAYTHATQYARALEDRGFDVSVVGGSRFFSDRTVALARAVLRVIANPRDDQALMTVLDSELVGLTPAVAWAIGHEVPGESVWERCRAVAESTPGAEAARGLLCVINAVDRARDRAGRAPLSEILLRFAEETDWDLTLLREGPEGSRAFANLLRLAGMATEFERSGGVGPSQFVEHLDAKERYGDHVTPVVLTDERRPAVRIMSIHASKGLEFPVVAVPELGSGGSADSDIALWDLEARPPVLGFRLPGSWATKVDGGTHSPLYREVRETRRAKSIAETMRLYYVACTRAREILLVSGSGSLKAVSDSPDVPLTWLRSALGVDATPGTVEVPITGGRVLVRVISAADYRPEGLGPQPEVSRSPRSAETITPEPLYEPASTPPAVPARYSYTDLAALDSCGLNYFHTRVRGMGVLATGPGSNPVQIGSAVHAILEAGQGVMPPANRCDAILDVFEIDDAADRAAAIEAVGRFLDSSTAQRLQGLERVRREWPFALYASTDGGEPFIVSGSIDAYGRTGASGLIVDYKTGTSGTPGELIERYRLQASIYALAALKDGCEHVEVIFTRPQAADISGAPQEVAFTFAAHDAPDIEADLARRHERVLSGDFHPLERWEPHLCESCPAAQGPCPVEPRAGWPFAYPRSTRCRS